MRANQAKRRKRIKATGETKRFADRRRWRSPFWTPRSEPRSPIPSTWPAFAEAVRKWGLPGVLQPRGLA